MSYRASEWAVRCHTGSAINKAVLLVLAEAADADGVCWPSQATIAGRAECSLRAVKSAMRALEAARLIERHRRADSQGHRTSDLVTLRVGQGVSAAPREETQDAPDAPGGEEPRCTSRPAKVQMVHGLGAPRAHKPVSEPVNESVTSVTPLPPVCGFMVEGLSGELLTVDEAFELWWAEWPNKVKRKESARLFGGILRKREATFAELVDSERRYSQTDRVRRGYVQHPTTWLRGEAWKDEPQAPTPIASPAFRPRLAWSALDLAIEGLPIGDDEHGGVA